LGFRLLQRLPREQTLEGIRLYGSFVQKFTKTLEKYVNYKKKMQRKKNPNNHSEDNNTCTLDASDIGKIMRRLSED